MKKVKLSELPLSTDYASVSVLGVSADNESVRVPLASLASGFKTATDGFRVLQNDMQLANDELETHKQRLDALTPVVLTQAEYDALVEAGTVLPTQHYAIIEDAEA